MDGITDRFTVIEMISVFDSN